MHIISRNILVAAALGVFSTASANTIENFNSRRGIELKQVRSALQNSCWTFHHFDVNRGGWNPSIEGDGAMVSAPDALRSGNAGIYTPLLKIDGTLSVSFNYRFDNDFAATDQRWMKICLADAGNKIIQVLEQFNAIGVHAKLIRKYSTRFDNISSGSYRLVLLYGGQGGDASLAIDELTTSADLQYKEGCTLAPEPGTIQVTGLANRTASGKLNLNNSEQRAFLVQNSENGRVDIQLDGTFVFQPHNGFKGEKTSFTYRVCDAGGYNLCSEPVKVSINFPGSQLVKFQGSYISHGQVRLSWHTANGNNVRSFAVERSTDGQSWSTTGVVNGTNVNEYTYTDRVGKNTALKKDLYYRLKHIDNQGQVNISKTMIVRVYNTPALTMICVAPNPQKREVAVAVQLQESSMVTIRIFDQSQNLLIHQTVEAERGLNNIAIDGSRELIPGSYQLEVTVNSKERMMVKLIKE